MLTAAISHDMRTPLNAIIGLLNSLETYIDEEIGRKYLKIIKGSSKLLFFLVNDLLDYVQLKNGKFKKSYKLVSIKQAINPLIEIFEVGAQEKGIELKCVFDDDLPE